MTVISAHNASIPGLTSPTQDIKLRLDIVPSQVLSLFNLPPAEVSTSMSVNPTSGPQGVKERLNIVEFLKNDKFRTLYVRALR